MTISIYSSSHGPSPKYQSKIIKAIQVGKSVNHYDYGLPLDDANGDNISLKNPYYCELTAQYWAWKNDTKSTHFGFVHYRRHLNFSQEKYKIDPWGCIVHPEVDEEYHEKFSINDEAITDLVNKYDLILPEKWDITPAGSTNNYDHYKNGEFLHIKDYDAALDILEEMYPEYVPYAKKFNEANTGYYTNIFVMDKALFCEYSEWLFSILSELENRVSIGDYNAQERRVIGHVAERLFNIFIEKVIDERKLSFVELQRTFVQNVPKVTSVEEKQKDKLPLVICFDNNYAHSAGALVHSIIKHSSKDKQYELNLFCDAVSQQNRTNFLALVKNSSNFSIRFVDTSSLFDSSKMNVSEHFTAATYARLFIPSVYKNYEKIVFIDADMIVCDDVAKLFDIDLNGKKIGAVKDIVTEGFIKFKHPAPKPFDGHTSYTYLKEYLNMEDPDHYFQAGLLVMDLNLMHQDNDAASLEKLIYEKKYWYHDQDILNKHFEDDIYYLPMEWNVYHGNGSTENFFPNLKLSTYQRFLEARENIKIIHYAGDQKPWINHRVDYAEYYFNHISHTPWSKIHTNQFENNLQISDFDELKKHVLFIVNEYAELSNIVRKSSNMEELKAHILYFSNENKEIPEHRKNAVVTSVLHQLESVSSRTESPFIISNALKAEKKQALINKLLKVTPRGSLGFRLIRKVYYIFK